MDPIVLHLDGEDSDAAELDDALRLLSQELSEAPDLEVEHKIEPPPPGTKSAGLLVALALQVIDSRGVASAIAVLKDFLSRHRTMKIKVQRGDTVYEISGATSQELATLIPQLVALSESARS